MQTYDLDNEDFLERDTSKGISGAQKQMLKYNTNLAVIVIINFVRTVFCRDNFSDDCIAR